MERHFGLGCSPFAASYRSQCEALPTYPAPIGNLQLWNPLNYNIGHGSVFKGNISSCFFYTMNATEEYLKQQHYEDIFQFYEKRLKLLNGTSEYLLSLDTYQFDNYSKYEASMFNEKTKLQIKEEQYPIDCQKAFNIGAKLAGISDKSKEFIGNN
jgi:hypothetical protein